jgi:hypothetical protein
LKERPKVYSLVRYLALEKGYWMELLRVSPTVFGYWMVPTTGLHLAYLKVQ